MKKALANHKTAKNDFLSINVKTPLNNGSNDQKKSQKKPQICHLCSNSFYNMKGLNRHIESVHEKKKPYLCDICSHSFTQKGHLNAHIATVHKGAFLIRSCLLTILGQFLTFALYHNYIR